MALADTASIVLQNGSGGTAFLLVALLFTVIVIAGVWKTFVKAGEPGWAAIIPIYNMYVMLKIGDNEWWWLLVIMFIPIVNLYGLYKMFRGVAEAFDQGVGFALGLWFLGFIFFPMLGFGDYSYNGSRAQGAQAV